MIRDIKFTGLPGCLSDALGVSDERGTEIEVFIEKMISKGASLQKIIEALNERGDLNDAEWTSTIYNLGVYCGKRIEQGTLEEWS